MLLGVAVGKLRQGDVGPLVVPAQLPERVQVLPEPFALVSVAREALEPEHQLIGQVARCPEDRAVLARFD